MKYNYKDGVRHSYRSLLLIWVLVVIMGVFTWFYINGKIFGLSAQRLVPGIEVHELQPAARAYYSQPTVSGAYLQWGDNPQVTAPASVLETGTTILETSSLHVD